MGLFSLSQIVSQMKGVVSVYACRHFVEPGDEGVLDPIDDEFATQNEETVGGQRPETLWEKRHFLLAFLVDGNVSTNI